MKKPFDLVPSVPRTGFGAFHLGLGLFLAAFVWPDRSPAQDFLWIEAESLSSASAHSIESNEVLSANRWVRLNDASSDRHIEWEGIEIPGDGTWEIYVRKFWRHGLFHWTLEGPTVPTQRGAVNADVVLLDEAELYKDNVANWVFVKEVKLKAGSHTFRIDQDTPGGAAAYDAILFTRTPFQPRGKLKPGEAYDPPPEPGFSDFQPARDTFEPTPIDLRHLNEDTAGSRGWIRRSGHQFAYPDNGDTVRFWGINLGPGVYSLDNARIRHLARFYAKRGINLVRLHGAIYEGSGTEMGTVKPWTLDRLHYAVKAFQDEGIYVMLSIYFPLWVEVDADDTRFPGYDGQHPFALPFFSSEFETLFRGWFDALLDTRNPYTGLKLAHDPSVLACELINEDSLFFWTFNQTNVPDPQMQVLEKQFGDWAAVEARYGSVEAALAAWGETRSRDDPGQGRIEIKPLWDLGNAPHTQRDRDTVRFLAEIQKAFFERNRDHLVDTLGYSGLVYGSNWITANASTLAPIDKWTNAGLDFLDRHGYYEPMHAGEAATWDVRAGTGYRDRSALRFDAPDSFSEKSFATPIMGINYGGLPSMITEINWPEPNRFRADCIPTIAAYAALQDIDGVVLFVTESDDWVSRSSKFPMQTPVTLSQFPGFALAYRKGLIQTGSPAIELTLFEDNLFALEGTPVPQPQNLDQLRDPGLGGGSDSVSSLAFMVGPVNVAFAEGSGSTGVQDHTPGYIDTTGQIVRSNTDELTLDYGTGLLTINAPQAQGATGFLKAAGSITLTDVTIESEMDYGSILLIALDDRPLADSEHILVQVASDDHFSGFATRAAEATDPEEIRAIPDAKVITDAGKAPIMVGAFQGTISLQRADAAALTVTACDENGIPGNTTGTADHFLLAPDVFYYLIRRNASQSFPNRSTPVSGPTGGRSQKADT